jgi:hypothetical protein
LTDSSAAPNELAGLVAAYSDLEAGRPPRSFTPAYVQARLVEAFQVIRKTAGSVGPKGYGNNWPEIFREFADYVGADDEQYRADRRAAILARADREVTSLELSRADEAMAWAARYLQDEPLACDALQLWAMCKAQHWQIEKVLRARAKRADRLLARLKADLPDVVTIYRDDANDAAAKIAAWCNTALEGEKDKRKRARIRAAARIRMRREVKATGAVERETRARRGDVMPGRVFSATRLEHHRKVGAALLAERLNAAGVRVR